MHSLLTYGFPMILLIFEWGLRTLIKVDASGFIGPTMAAAGLSFTIPLTRPKQLSISVGDSKAVVTSKHDVHFVAFIWLMILAFLFNWAAACYFSLQAADQQIFGFKVHAFLGFAAYILSLIFSRIKEYT